MSGLLHLDELRAARGIALPNPGVRPAPPRAEDTFQFSDALVEHAPLGCGVFRPDGHCVMFNQALAGTAGASAVDLQALGLWRWLADRAPALSGPARAVLDDGQTRKAMVALRAEGSAKAPLAWTLARIARSGQPHLLVYAGEGARQRQEHDALELRGIDNDPFRAEHQPFDLEAMLQRNVDLFGAGIQHKGLECVVDLAPELPTRLVGDGRRLSQVLDRLVGNALKFTEQGHLRIAVRELPTADPRRCALRFSVHDSGIGIGPERCAELFDAQVQVGKPIAGRHGGAGSGLATCRQRVEMLGGRIGVESVPGKGSDFWFTVELQRTGFADPGPPAPTDVAGLRVLLVDDGSAAGRVIEARLRAWQVVVAGSASALAAARQIEQARDRRAGFDLVLVHWRAQDVDGLRELMRQHGARDATKSTPLIAMLTDGSRDAQNRAVGGAPVDAVLVKPVLAAPLLGLLRKTLALRGRPVPA
jgi:CheY-like chemotaxis protein